MASRTTATMTATRDTGTTTTTETTTTTKVAVTTEETTATTKTEATVVDIKAVVAVIPAIVMAVVAVIKAIVMVAVAVIPAADEAATTEDIRFSIAITLNLMASLLWFPGLCSSKHFYRGEMRGVRLYCCEIMMFQSSFCFYFVRFRCIVPFIYFYQK